MARKRSLSTGAITGWAVLGLGAGLVAGMLAAELLGVVNPDRVGRMVRRWSGRPEGPLGARAAAEAAGAAIDADPELASLGLDAFGAARGVVELRGWVESRAQRARAVRAVQAVAGIETLINNILVRGEDDLPLRPTRASSGKDTLPADQSA